MSAGVFILILVVAIAALVLMIVKAKMHPVLALFIAALGTGIALGYGVTGSVDYISNGFGGTLGSVGITIILGAIISMAIEDTGAAKVIANFFIKLFRGKRMELAPGIEVRFVDVGHLLGSASIELWITEGDTTTKLVFSGDIGMVSNVLVF